MEDIQAVLARAHSAIDRANALTAEVRTLRAAAETQSRHAELLLELADLEVAHAERPADTGGAPPNSAAPSEAAQDAISSPAASTQRCTANGSNAHAPDAAYHRAAVPCSGPAVGADSAASAGTVAAAGCIVQRQQGPGLEGLLQLRRRQLRLRACQLRALRCLVMAEPQLADFPIQVRK